MWIVRLALRRPYTIAVVSLLILVLGILSLSRMIVDIFPPVNIPVVLVAWNYPGLSAVEMERRVVITKPTMAVAPAAFTKSGLNRAVRPRACVQKVKVARDSDWRPGNESAAATVRFQLACFL